ncbi:MAG: hypothetical protein QM639_15675 [Rhodocyclaceae bacterium]
MRVLLVEDDEGKARSIADFVRANFSGATVQVVGSSSSALKAIISGASSIDCILLDMSMPNFDNSARDLAAGGAEHFAGRELLAQMKLRRVNVPTIVVTMLDEFGELPTKVSLETLSAELSRHYSPPYCGYVYYNSAQEGWRAALLKLINESQSKGIA